MRKLVALTVLALPLAGWAEVRAPAIPRLLKSEELKIAIQPDDLNRQYGALQEMQLEVLEYSKRGPVRHLRGNTGIVLPAGIANLKPGDSGSEVLQRFKDVLLAKGTEALVVTRNDERSGARSLRLSQEIQGIPVVQGFVGVNFDDSTRQVTEFAAFFIPDRGLNKSPVISTSEAEKLVAGAIHQTSKSEVKFDVEIIGGTHLAYFADSGKSAPADLVWVVQVQVAEGEQWAYYVDAISGLVVARMLETQFLTRRVYNANNTQPTIPSGLPVQMTLAQIANDLQANTAYTNIDVADTKLRLRFSLPSSNFPSSTKQVIKYGMTVPNALHKLIGNDDFVIYSKTLPAAISPTQIADITYHEYAHGVAFRTFPMGTDLWNHEGGALHEGFGDIAAATIQIAVAGTPSGASWRFAEGWWNGTTKALRSLANPTGDAYPEAAMNWYPLRGWGESAKWMNSGILTHAYYLSLHGGPNSSWLEPHIPDFLVPPLSITDASAEPIARQIFVAAFDSIALGANPTFFQMKASAMDAANTTYGPVARDSVKKAFEAVGVGYQCSAEPPEPNPTLFDLQCNGRFSVNWPDVASADRYIVMVAPQLYGWGFSEVTTDGDINHCMTQVASPSMLRMVACNSCGCSDWSDTEYMPFWPGQCP